METRNQRCSSSVRKVIPGYGGGLRTCDLVRTQITDITIKGAWDGPPASNSSSTSWHPWPTSP